MPYYCTVPRCTSMAGKAKNVSFHQFPRDEVLASIWNTILKRGKPYTKYSKVCSLHFRPEDYTITSVGKNKGQWRTLRKDAIPSQNLPSDSPVPTRRNSNAWAPNSPGDMVNSTMQQQMAHAIYMQTMLAMQAASNGPTQSNTSLNDNTAHTSKILISDLEQILKNTPKSIEQSKQEILHKNTSYKCEECSKCFKDPDVFVLHRRTHNKNERLNEDISVKEKENFNSNRDVKQETLQANPILANLLRSDVPSFNMFDANNVISIENQIMAALTTNMESYIRNLTSMLQQNSSQNGVESESIETDIEDVVGDNLVSETQNDLEKSPDTRQVCEDSIQDSFKDEECLDSNSEQNGDSEKANESQNAKTNEIYCNLELNGSKDSVNLVIDENS